MSIPSARKRAGLVLVGLFLTAVGCVSVNKSILDRSRMAYPVPPDSVHVYLPGDSLPPYRRIAILDAKGNYHYVGQNKLIDHLRKEAGKLGANAVILGQVSSPGTGAKVASVLVGTSANRKEQAIAIYVPSLHRGG